VTTAAERGMVATSHPLAAQAGVDVLAAGGSAADAAVAAAAVLCVVDPRSTGIGGDAFALHWAPGAREPRALAGAGPAPAGLSAEALAAAGFAAMPQLGPWTITIPGAVSAWETLLGRCGRLGLERVLAPAIALAADGFAVTPNVAAEWASSAHRLEHDAAARALLLPGVRPPAAGVRWANPELAAVLRGIADGGADAFYRGRTAELIGAAVERAGGALRAADLAGWKGAEWVAPLRRRFRDTEVFELPPPGQGIVVLEALGIFEPLDFPAPLDSSARADEEHAAIEALKLAFADAARYLADPDVVAVPSDVLLSDGYLATRRAQLDMAAASVAEAGAVSDTVYVCAVDGEGGACSFIQSLYEGFGSGVAVPGTGIVLQNRGSNFVLEPGHPNRVSPGKRPYHTIMPAMLGRDRSFCGCLGVVGGFMQPQGQMQILRHVLDHGLGVQAAIDAPRVRFTRGREIAVEPGFDREVVAELARRGHVIGELDRFSAGGAQAILRDGDRLRGGSDPRKGGVALGG
jgi:gamma-glutamyltranspeptidase/glutathione hydrolase